MIICFLINKFLLKFQTYLFHNTNGNRYSPLNKSYKPVDDMTYNTLLASHVATAIEEAKKVIDIGD